LLSCSSLMCCRKCLTLCWSFRTACKLWIPCFRNPSAGCSSHPSNQSCRVGLPVLLWCRDGAYRGLRIGCFICPLGLPFHSYVFTFHAFLFYPSYCQMLLPSRSPSCSLPSLGPAHSEVWARKGQLWGWYVLSRPTTVYGKQWATT